MRKIWNAVQFLVLSLSIAGVVAINVIAQEKKQEESPASTTTNSVIVSQPLVPIATTNIQPFPLTLPMVAPIEPLGNVQNASFSGEVVNESIQTLIDGNRIIQRSSSMVYRDSQGRTRIEWSFKSINAQTRGENAEHKTISISDPVSGVSYSLDPQARTAYKYATGDFGVGVSQSTTGAHQPAAAPNAAPVVQRFQRYVAVIGFGQTNGAPIISSSEQGIPCKNESLGKQVIEGVEAEGTRTTCTIPEGAVGNERPIEYFLERYYSGELQMVVMTKSSDPRSGEATQRLTNINRDEPDASLFQPPADYTISEPQMLKDIIERRNKLSENNREPNHQ
ncbi:MAG: hypothetical protein J2P31_02075 [Blastocatellia bacterium]|nr:hypothetical protein [Blastocatellia bacterium]